MQENGTIENGVYPDVWRDSHGVNSWVGFLLEHDGGEIWKAEEGFDVCMFVILLLMDKFPIGQLGNFSFMPFVRYSIGSVFDMIL